MLLAILLACTPEPVHGPAVVVVVADTLRADLGGAPVPGWWAGGRQYTRAYSGATHTVASLPVLASGRAATERELSSSLPGTWHGELRPGVNLPSYPTDAWPDRAVTDHFALALAGAVSTDDVVPFFGPGSRSFPEAAVNAIHEGGADALLLWSSGAHSPYDGLLVDRQGRRLETRTTDAAMIAANRGTLTADQPGYLRLSYAAGAERALASLEIVVVEALQAGAVVILTADHGEALGEGGRWGHGRSLDDEQVRVPLVVWGPGIDGGIDDRPVPATCVGQTARAVLGADVACDLRVGRLPPEPPVVGMMVGEVWEERVIVPEPVAVAP